jgi:hypothetical protein
MPPATTRLCKLRTHLRPSSAAAAVQQQEWAQPPPPPNPRLLTDAELQQFVVDGFLVLQQLDDFPSSFHRKIYEDARGIFERSGRAAGGAGNEGLGHSNDIYPAIKELGDVMACPTVAGALESVLGPGYEMNAHRHMHHSSVQAKNQTWHKDSQRHKPPGFLPDKLFIFYYPGGVTDGMGPTELYPMSQYLGADNQEWDQDTVGQRITTAAAHEPVAVMAHLGMIHRATRRLAEEDESTPWRPMMKFIFSSCADDTSKGSQGPSWNHQPSAARPWSELTSEPALIPAMQTQWEWLLAGRGTKPPPTPTGPAASASTESVLALRRRLLAESRPADEAERVGVACRLGRIARAEHAAAAPAAVEALLEALHGSSGLGAQRVAVSGLVTAGAVAVDGLCSTLETATDDQVLMFAADALKDAVPREVIATAAATRATAALETAIRRLESMVETSPLLQAWAAAAETEDDGAPQATGIFAVGRATERQQWELAEDSALAACQVAISRFQTNQV